MRKYILFAILTAVALFAYNWKSPAEHKGWEYTGDKPEAFEPYASNILRHNFTADTITDAENDTLSLPYNLFSSFTSLYQMTRTNLSGTTNVAVTLQQSALTSGNTDWITVGTTSGTGATAEALTLNPTYGVRYRLIFDGTGTQSSRYTLTAVLKKL